MHEINEEWYRQKLDQMTFTELREIINTFRQELLETNTLVNKSSSLLSQYEMTEDEQYLTEIRSLIAAYLISQPMQMYTQ